MSAVFPDTVETADRLQPMLVATSKDESKPVSLRTMARGLGDVFVKRKREGKLRFEATGIFFVPVVPVREAPKRALPAPVAKESATKSPAPSAPSLLTTLAPKPIVVASVAPSSQNNEQQASRSAPMVNFEDSDGEVPESEKVVEKVVEKSPVAVRVSESKRQRVDDEYVFLSSCSLRPPPIFARAR